MLGHNAAQRAAQCVKHGGVGADGVDDHGVVVHHVHRLQPGEVVLHDGVIPRPLVGVLHILRGKGLAVVEGHALPELELDGVLIQKLPFGSQHGNHIIVRIPAHQGVENIACHAVGEVLLAHVEVQGVDVAGLRPDNGVLCFASAFISTGSGGSGRLRIGGVAAASQQRQYQGGGEGQRD